MKKKSKAEIQDELRPEYDLRELLKEGVRGKYFRSFEAGTNVVLLDPDVATAFPDSEAVNEALRLVLKIRKISIRKRRSAGA
jgi:hypothetical protein